MKTLKAKLTALFMTIGCFAVCLGTGVAIATQPEATQVTASAAKGAEVHELGKFDLHVNSSVGGAAGVNSQLYLKRADGGELPIKTWDKAFSVAREGSFKINGVPFTPAEIKSTGDGFWVNFGAVNAGDVVTLDGTFVYRNDAMSVKYIIEESSFKWTGSGWVVLGETLDYATYNISTIAPAGGCTAGVVYAYPVDETQKPDVNSWDHKFTFKAGSGSGICLNGVQLSGYEIKQPGDFYIVLGKAAAAGDVLTIDGFFYNDTIAKAIAFNNSSLVYDGSAWTTNDAGVANTFTITEIGATGDSTNAVVYPYPADETQKPTTGSWTHMYTFVADSGEGITLNGAPLTGYEMKQPGDFYIVLGKTAVAGDVLILDGIFYSADANARMIFCDSTLRYNGTTWETYNYINDTYVGKVVPTAYCNASQLYLLKENGEKLIDREADDAAWADFYSFDTYSGVGVTLNGESVLAEAKVPNDLFIGLSKEAQVGDLLVVEGAFYNNDLNVRYVVDKTELEWTGSAWVEHINYTTYNVGAVTAVDGSTGVYFSFAETLPVSTWDQAFLLESGNGITVNGIGVDMVNNVKSVERLYATLGEVKSGDILTIGGTFYNEFNAVKYVVDESTFVFNGTAWEAYVEYTTYTFNELSGANGCTDSVIYAYPTAGDTLPSGDWDNKFTLESGAGLKLNDTVLEGWEIKQPGDFYIVLNTTASEGDVFTIDGTFINNATAKKFVFNNCQLQFNGTTWVTVKNYTTYDLGKVVAVVDGDASSGYLKFAEGVTLPISSWDYAFMLFSGSGITVDGEPIDMTNNVKSVGDKLYVTLTPTPASTNSTLSISGTFYNEALAIKYVVEESKFTWNGSAWEEYVDYTTYDVGKVTIINKDSSASKLNIDPASGEKFAVTDGTWAEKLTFLTGSGVGITLNGNQINMNDIKIPNNMFVGLGTTAVAGDILVIGGTFYNKNLAVKYIVEESKFIFNGTVWNELVSTYTISNLKPTASGSTSKTPVYLKINGNTDLPIVNSSYTFTKDTITFVKQDGTDVSITKIQSTADGFTFRFASNKVADGDVLTLSGTVYCEALDVTYDIQACTIRWTGSAWETYVPYVTYEIGPVVIGANSVAEKVYFDPASGGKFAVTDGTWTEKLTYESGTGITLNGTKINMNDIKIPNNLYVGLGTTAKKGDMLVIGGTFYNANLDVKYVIEDSTFIWTGSAWVAAKPDYSNLVEGVTYDKVTILDLGLGLETTANGKFDGAGLSYVASSANTTGSVVFRFGFTASDVETNVIDIRMRGTAWNGIRFILGGGALQSYYLEQSEGVALVNNQYYVIELGAIDTADGNSLWIYAKVDGLLVISNVVAKTDVVVPLVGSEFDGTTFGDYTSNHISIYSGNIHATWRDPDHVAVTYTTNLGTFVDYADRNSAYSLLNGKTYETFIGWMADGNLYEAGATFDVGDDNLVFEALSIKFFLEDGAAIRLSDSTNESGIRFTTKISEASLTKLQNNGVTVVSYGTLIIPLDYLGAGQAPNLEQFTAGENIVKIPSTYQETEDGYVVYRGAMKKLNEGNYERLFAGRSYMEISVNGVNKIIYTNFDLEDNVRSIRYVAQEFKADTAEYNAISDTKKAVVDVYAAEGIIDLMNYESYKDNNFLNLIAWYYPELDPSNQYDNQHNRDIAEDLTDAGMKAIYLDGDHHLDLNTDENIEKTRQIIHFFWSQGLYTIAFGSNASTNCYIDYSSRTFPDFSDCQGFLGFLVWDEPGSGSMSTLASFANNFETIYAGSGVTFMVNLLPSYATDFNAGSSNWWESSLETLDKAAYKTYMEAYCKNVLSQLDGGKKWLSLDSYPINADYSLTPNFLFDLAMLKYYAEQYDAHAHSALQASGWVEGGNDSKNRMPEEAELRMQAYTAMAFGMDSISWWSYGNMRGDNQQNPADNDTYYTRFANVNVELQKISHIYSAFNRWQGVILGTGKDNGLVDEDYEAYAAVCGQIGDYELSATDTKHLASISTNKTNLNYLMGVSQDMNGNECYVISNYNSHEENREQTLTLKFETNVTEVIIYRGGVATKQAVNSKTLTINLATGEGVIVIPSALAQ